MTAKQLDGAQLAILANRFEGVSSKMGNTLLRTGRSGVLNRAKDFSCCILTADCDLLAVAESLPIHVLSGPDIMARSMKEFHPDLKKGRRLPAQLALSRLFASRRSHDHHAGDR